MQARRRVPPIALVQSIPVRDVSERRRSRRRVRSPHGTGRTDKRRGAVLPIPAFSKFKNILKYFAQDDVRGPLLVEERACVAVLRVGSTEFSEIHRLRNDYEIPSLGAPIGRLRSAVRERRPDGVRKARRAVAH